MRWWKETQANPAATETKERATETNKIQPKYVWIMESNSQRRVKKKMSEKQNKSLRDCRQSAGDSKEEVSRRQRHHPGEQQTHYYLLWKPSCAWAFLSSGKEWLDMTTQLGTERHTSTDLWGKELKMKYWPHSSGNSPRALKRLRRQFGLQYYY